MSGKNDLHQFDDIVEELKQRVTRPSALDHSFKNSLRNQLITQHTQPRLSLNSLWRWGGTAVALGALAFIVFLSWTTLSQRSNATNAQMGTVNVPDRNAFIVYDQLKVELPVWSEFDSGYAEITVESWQSLDGTFFRGEVVDANNKQRVFVQSDGQFLWRGTFDSSVNLMETASLQYFDVYHALAQAEGWAGTATTPPFYDDMGWDGLAQSVVRLDWNCIGAECINNYLIEPPLGVNGQDGEYDDYGWGVSKLEDQTTANGRSLTSYIIEYSPNQDGIASTQHRIVKLDANSNLVVEVADYDGETLLRRLERTSHQLIPSNNIPQTQFTQLPKGMGVSYILPEGRVAEQTSLRSEPGGAVTAILPAGTQIRFDGIMENQPDRTVDSTTWHHVDVEGIGEGWVDGAQLQWPLTFNGEVVELDISHLPTAVPIQTQLTILRTYQGELQAMQPHENQRQLEQLLIEIAAEIDHLEQQSVPAQFVEETAVSQTQTSPASLDFPKSLGDHILLRDVLFEQRLYFSEELLEINLYWETSGQPTANYIAAVHIQDPFGNLLAQVDKPLGDSSNFGSETQIEMNVSLQIPSSLSSGPYPIFVLLYDGSTGQQLPTDKPATYLGQIEVVNETDIYPQATINSTDGNGLTLRREPSGQQIAILAEGSTVFLIEECLQEKEGLFWQAVKPVGEEQGWVASQFLTYPVNYNLDCETAVAPLTGSGANAVWLISANQNLRDVASEPIMGNLTVGYHFDLEEEIWLQPFYAEAQSEAKATEEQQLHNCVPMAELGNPVLLNEAAGTHTFSFTKSPDELRQLIGVDEPELIVQAGYFEEDENGRQVFKILGTTPCPFFAIKLNSTGGFFTEMNSEITSHNTLEVVSISPSPGSQLQGVTTFTITIRHQLATLNAANLVTTFMPFEEGATIVGNDVQLISHGSGETTYSFVFEPLVNEVSEWIVFIELRDPNKSLSALALANTTPHTDLPNDIYRYEP